MAPEACLGVSMNFSIVRAAGWLQGQDIRVKATEGLALWADPAIMMSLRTPPSPGRCSKMHLLFTSLGHLAEVFPSAGPDPLVSTAYTAQVEASP